jgi:PAP2 superfamily
MVNFYEKILFERIKHSLRPLTFLLVVSLLISSCKDKSIDDPDPTPVGKSKATSTFDQSVATRWMDMQFKLIKSTPGYTPPVAARTLGYTSLALYESVVPGMTGYQSLVGQLNGLKELPKIDETKEYNYAIAANSAIYTLIKEMYATTADSNKRNIDSLRRNIESNLVRDADNQEVSTRSINFGADIAKAIFEYSKTDGGHEGWKNNYPTDYTVPIGIGFWEPTSTQKIPMLPYWGKNRPFVAINATTDPVAPTTFSYKLDSKMFILAKEVYDVNKSLTADQKAIAMFWADGGSTLTPPGHHLNIANIVLKKEKSKLDKVAETYVKVALAVNDAFIACWRCKYRYNLMRPMTYIRQTIDPAWSPLITTPPFPEYSSGHSSGSGAASETLTTLFGDNYAFIDNTWEGKYPNRTFKSFYEYANEATTSRLYGGIHYRQANEEGQKNGKAIAKNVLALKFKK